MIGDRAVLPTAPARQMFDARAMVVATLGLLLSLVGIFAGHRLLADPALVDLAQALVGWGSRFVAWLPFGLWVVVDLLLIRAWFVRRSLLRKVRAHGPANIHKIN